MFFLKKNQYHIPFYIIKDITIPFYVILLFVDHEILYLGWHTYGRISIHFQMRNLKRYVQSYIKVFFYQVEAA